MSSRIAGPLADIRGPRPMSIEMHVFFRGKLPSKATLSRALKELGFPFTIKPATGSLEQQSGYMPMLLRHDETGVEFDVFDDPDALAKFGDIGVNASLNRAANFRWAGDMQEAVAGMCCTAALAKLVNGVVFDGEEGVLRSVDEAIAFARRHLAEVVKPDSNPKLGTRPAHIKRYLKPLLKLRPDLVLVGRDLIIRPVRHVFRAVYFDRTSDKYAFHIQSFVSAMSGIVGGGGSELDRGLWKVYEPYFEPLLLDTLQNDVFAEIGQARTLLDLPRGDRFLALVLSGRLEEAAEFIESDRTRPVDPDHARSDVEACRNEIARKRRALLAHGIAKLCEECHRKERERAEKRKLGDIWEPSPFPVELSGADRESLASDPLFETTPWVSLPADRRADHSDMLNGFAIALAMKYLRLRSGHAGEARHVGRKYAIELDARQRRCEPRAIPMMPVLHGSRVLRLVDDVARQCPLDRTVTQGDDTGAPPSEIAAFDESSSVAHSLGRWTASIIRRCGLDHTRPKVRTFTQAGHGQFSLLRVYLRSGDC
jgi:hypothetical protein